MELGPIWQAVFFQAVMIGLTALVNTLKSAAECITDNRLERLADEGDERAAKLRERVDRMETNMRSIQLAGWITTFAAGFMGAVGFVEPIRKLIPAQGLANAALCGIALAVCCLTQILGICLPRRLCAIRPDELAMSMFRPVEIIGGFFSPVYRFSDLLVRGILRLMRVDINQTTEKVTEDEILAMVDMGEEKGAIETNEREMIENIFEFNNKSVEACMTHRTDMTAISADASEEEIIALIEETGLSRYPVYDKDMDDIIGILISRHYLLNARSASPKSLRELVRPAYFIPCSMKTDRLFQEMQTRQNHMAIVVDEYGGTCGLITMEDLLEEIVGDIYDESDEQAEVELVDLGDGSWRAAGSVHLDALCEALEIDQLDDEEYDTLGGLVFSQLTEIPEDGSHPEVECFGLNIRVEELSERRVEWAIVRRIEPEQPSGEA